MPRQRVSVALTDQQYELLRRRTLSQQVTIQTALSAAVNAYVLGDLRVLPNGRYHVAGPTAPLSRDDEVTVRAPTSDDPDRTVTITQSPAAGRRVLTTAWLTDEIHRRLGKRLSQRMTRTLLSHLEDTGRVDPREGRYWKFSGSDDPTVAAVLVAIDDGTLRDIARAATSEIANP